MVYSKRWRMAGVSLVACLSLVTGFVAPLSHVSMPKEDWRKTDVIDGGRRMSPTLSKSTPTALRASAVPANGDILGTGRSAPYNYGPAITLGKLKINIFGAIFGIWEVFWGCIFWYPSLLLYIIARKVSAILPGNILQRIDPYRRIPICVGYTWGLLSMTLFGMWPKIEGKENLEVLRDENGKLRPAMYVANHCSWMDIPYVGRIFKFMNYKMIAKAELAKVPILGRAIMEGGHLALDRSNRRSQMKTFKEGVRCLENGVNLVTFPEGTRSKDAKLSSFKKGAFKMAQKCNAYIVPMAIHNADAVQPKEYAFPAKSSRFNRPKAVIRIMKPVATEGMSDDDLLEEVWNNIAEGLPERQKPSPDTPVGVQ